MGPARGIYLWKDERPSKDVVAYTLVDDRDTLDCVTVYWPSRCGEREASEPKRIMAAKATEAVVGSLYKVRENDDIIVIGDFNDEPGDVSVANYLRGSGKLPNADERAKIFLDDALYEVYVDSLQETNYYRGSWNTIDQILLVSGLFDRAGFGTDNPASRVFVLPFMREQEGRYKDAPYRTYVGPRYLGGISDHFPVYIQLNHYNETRE